MRGRTTAGSRAGSLRQTSGRAMYRLSRKPRAERPPQTVPGSKFAAFWRIFVHGSSLPLREIPTRFSSRRAPHAPTVTTLATIGTSFVPIWRPPALPPLLDSFDPLPGAAGLALRVIPPSAQARAGVLRISPRRWPAKEPRHSGQTPSVLPTPETTKQSESSC